MSGDAPQPTGEVARKKGALIMAEKEASRLQDERGEIHVSFTLEAYAALQLLANSTNRSVERVLADAIGREKWFWKVKARGGRVLAEYPDGEEYEIID